jgi:ribonuclease HII
MRREELQNYVLGIDEAGRGPWAGPMTAGLVILKEDVRFRAVKDSKKMSEAAREDSVDEIMSRSLFHRIKSVSSDEIDQMGIGKAWTVLMRSLLEEAYKLYPGVRGVIDGVQLVPGFRHVMAIPKADNIVPAVSAASVLAKYRQTCCMDGYHTEYPEYGFDEHRGYGTPKHQAALERHGICPIHRKSFKPIKSLISRTAGW